MTSNEIKDPFLISLFKKEEKDEYKNRIFVRSLSNFHWFCEEDRQKHPDRRFSKGIVLGHGHNHGFEILARIKIVQYWYMVDANRLSYPDYLASAYDTEAMNYFPAAYFDVVLTEQCPIEREIGPLFTVLYRILSDDGVLIMTELPKLAFWFLDKTDLEDFIDKINSILHHETIEKMKEKWIEKNHTNQINNTFYYEFIIGNYDDPNKSILTDIFQQRLLNATKSTLNKYNFRLINMKGRFLIAKKSNNI